MLRRGRLGHHLIWITLGQLCLVVGLATPQFVDPASDPWQSLVAGLAGAFVGASVVFNLRGLYLFGRQLRHGR